MILRALSLLCTVLLTVVGCAGPVEEPLPETSSQASPAPAATMAADVTNRLDAAVEDALAGVHRVQAFLGGGVDAEQLDRIKMQLRASQIYARDDVGDIARLYGGALTQGLTVEDVQAWPDLLQNVTEDDIIAAAREVFDRRQAVTGWLMSEEMTQ